MSDDKLLYRLTIVVGLLCGVMNGAVQGGEHQAGPALGSSHVGITRCLFGAFVLESDPAGLNVRQGPSLSGKIIGVLPPVVISSVLDGYQVKVEVEIGAADHGWFQVAHAQDNTELTGRPARPVFSGIGWVSGRKLTVKSQADKGHVRPDETAPVILRLRDGTGFDNDELVQAGRLISCQGEWALVEFAGDKLSAAMRDLVVVDPVAQRGLAKGRFRAWVNRICAIQETSCNDLGAHD